MTLFLALMLAAAPVVEVRHADPSPRIDGRLEELWFRADTVDRFIQAHPQEGAEPSERTEVFVLQDDEHLYVAVRGWAEKAPPVGRLLGLEDQITLYLDPMNSRSSGYIFRLYGSGLMHSGLILDNGATYDWSWEGVWSGAVRLYPDRLEAEFAIPFKSIRYQAGAPEWGLNIERYIVRERERVNLIEVRRTEGGLQVSKFARLRGISPGVYGHHFELFPEGYVRYDRSGPDAPDRVKPFASLNLKWDPTPRTTFNATVLPDFAQIESDPYSFNISRYPVLLSEQRPFFVEGGELFRLSGGFGTFTPHRLFHSRRIGRPVAGEPVPILAGLKFTTRSSDRSLGILGAYTDEVGDEADGIIEPRRGFAVLTGRAGLADNTGLGLQFAGTAAGPDDYNYVLGSSWSLQAGPHRAAVEAAFSDRTGTPGWALNSGYLSFREKSFGFAQFELVSDSFSVADIGYLPWSGLMRIAGAGGPAFRGRGRNFQSFGLAPGAALTRHPGSDRMSGVGMLITEAGFRDWGLEFGLEAGPQHEADTGFFGRSARISYWGHSLKHRLYLGASGEHGYNYRRGWLAASYSNYANLTYYLFGRLALTLAGNNWWECEPAGGLAGVTSVLRPGVNVRVNARTSVNAYSEMVFDAPTADLLRSELRSNRLGLLFSWNFRPKSWLYVALNDLAADQGAGLEPAARVAAVKLRYLFQF